MNFDKDRLYHVYNQGNNRKKIFFTRENYLVFYKKIEIFICPYADILAWCLMPNHFHFMLLVKETELSCEWENTSDSACSQTLNKSVFKKRTLNDSLGIMLRSYTRIINAQEGFTGSLFRKQTKANCIDAFKDLQPNFLKSKIAVFNMLPENQYPGICFQYIHHNPVKSGLVEKDTDWEFSSARDYANLRSKSIVRREITENYVDV